MTRASTPLSSAAGRIASTARDVSSATSTGPSATRSASPRSARSAADLRRARGGDRCCAGSPRGMRCPMSPSSASSSCIISRKPEIDVNGVRSSCDTVATNASRIRSSSRSAVTSRSVQMRPAKLPSGSGPAPCSRGTRVRSGDLELVDVDPPGLVRQLEHSLRGSAPARRSCRRPRAAAPAPCRPCGMPSSRRSRRSGRFEIRMFALLVGEADAVERRVDEGRLQERDTAVRFLARPQPPADEG